MALRTLRRLVTTRRADYVRMPRRRRSMQQGGQWAKSECLKKICYSESYARMSITCTMWSDDTNSKRDEWLSEDFGIVAVSSADVQFSALLCRSMSLGSITSRYVIRTRHDAQFFPNYRSFSHSIVPLTARLNWPMSNAFESSLSIVVMSCFLRLQYKWSNPLQKRLCCCLFSTCRLQDQDWKRKIAT